MRTSTVESWEEPPGGEGGGRTASRLGHKARVQLKANGWWEGSQVGVPLSQTTRQLPDFHVTSPCGPNCSPDYLRASGLQLSPKWVGLLSETQIVLQIIFNCFIETSGSHLGQTAPDRPWPVLMGLLGFSHPAPFLTSPSLTLHPKGTEPRQHV